MPRVDVKIPACGLHFRINARDGATIISLLRSLQESTTLGCRLLAGGPHGKDYAECRLLAGGPHGKDYAGCRLLAGGPHGKDYAGVQIACRRTARKGLRGVQIA